MPDDDARKPSRAFWSGTITFGLVSIPVDLFAAIQARRTSMRLVDTKGRPLGRRYVSAKGGRELGQDDIVRGYETDTGKMIVVTDEELEAIAPDKSRDILLRRFVPKDEIAPIYYDRPYFLAPAGRSTRAYHLLAQAMERNGRVGIGSFVMRDHEYLVAIISERGVLRAETLRYADEVRKPADVGLPEPKKPSKKRMDAFVKAIASLRRQKLDYDELADRYAEALEKLARKKAREGGEVVDIRAAEPDEEGGAEIIDLVKLLKERLAGKDAGGARSGARRASGRARKHGNGDLADLSKSELYERARKLGIAGRSKMGRAKLIEAIEAAA